MSDTSDTRTPRDDGAEDQSSLSNPFRGLLRLLLRGRGDAPLRNTIEELIEDRGGETAIAAEEHLLLSNILKLHEKTVEDAMVPRVDIVAIEVDTPVPDVLRYMAEEAHSRMPVYRETLDDVVGVVHIKDLLPCIVENRNCKLQDLVRDMPIVTLGMKVLDLLRQMRQSRQHMALVVDEYGGIDGLVTIEDLVEEIVGDIADEHDEEEAHKLVIRPDGTMIADARVPIEDFEERVGAVLDDDERDEIDTLGGLVFSLAGRVPKRGEVLKHSSGLDFEVLDADPRRIKRVRVRNLPADRLAVKTAVRA